MAPQRSSSHRPSLNPDIKVRSAPAKINLALAVGPPRESDSLHPICSWFAPINLTDELRITRLEEDRLSRYAILWHEDALRPTAIDWSITKDLAVRAHMLLEREVGRTLPVQLKLTKRIPVGAGLGGGSSNAAAMLLGVCELFDLDITDQRLAELALSLGSDVPFFLKPGPALVEGVGQSVESAPPLAGHPTALALLFPNFACPTAAVYRAFDERPTRPMRDHAVRELARAPRLISADLFNDLADPAQRVAPDLAALRDRAARCAQSPVHITGSGSAMFTLCEGGMSHAEELASRLAAHLEGCAVTTASFA